MFQGLKGNELRFYFIIAAWKASTVCVRSSLVLQSDPVPYPSKDYEMHVLATRHVLSEKRKSIWEQCASKHNEITVQK